MLERRSIRWFTIWLGWTLIAFFFATHSFINAYLGSQYAPRPMTLRQALILSLSEWYVWAALAPLIVWLARRFPIERPRLFRGLVIHASAALILAIFKVGLDIWVIQLLGWNPNRTMTSFRLHPNLLTYAAIVGATHALEYYRRYRERELRASRLETELAQAQLQALKMQLHPHFLFNTLHAISALMHRDVEAADRMMSRLSDLLRLTLENAGVQEVRLKQELEFLERYLEIQQTRFADRLKIEVDIDPTTLDARVPNLILQPLVENSIRHGIAAREASGRIEVRAGREGEMLRLEVYDNGPGLVSDSREGVGLANTRARLEQLYGERHYFGMGNSPAGGSLVTVKIPFVT
jgi:two-component system, LytTR family, sensor kinase